MSKEEIMVLDAEQIEARKAELKDELARTAISITCIDRNGKCGEADGRG